MNSVPALLGIPHPAASAALLMPWRQLGRGARWAWVGVLLMLVAAAAVVAWLASPVPRMLMLISVAVALALLVWGGQISGLLEQNQPLAARLVPAHVRVLQRVALAAWFVLSLALGTVAWWLADGRLGWPGCLLVAAAGLASLAWCLRWPLLWFMPAVWPVMWGLPAAHGALQPLWQAGVAAWQAHLAVATMALLGLLALSLAGLFGHGGPAHARVFARQARWRELGRHGGVDGSLQGFSTWGGWWARLAGPMERLAGGWLSHLLRRAAPGHRSVMARAEVVLHGGQHWLRHLAGVGVALVLVGLGSIALLMVLLPPDVGVQTILQNGHVGIVIGLTTAGLSIVFTLPKSLWVSRREQALLVLLPGMPQGRALNRAVAVMQLRHAGIAWLATAVVTTALAWRAGNALALCVPVAALPIGVLWLMRAPARVGPPSAWKDVAPVFAYIAAGLALMVAVRQQPWDGFEAVAALAAASAVLSLLLGAWRWRHLAAAPTALPAGRLA